MESQTNSVRGLMQVGRQSQTVPISTPYAGTLPRQNESIKSGHPKCTTKKNTCTKPTHERSGPKPSTSGLQNVARQQDEDISSDDETDESDKERCCFYILKMTTD